MGERVRALLKLAKRGRTAQQLATELGKHQPRHGKSRRAYYDWDNDPESLSAVALMKAIELAGPDASAILFPTSARRRPTETFEQMFDRMRATLSAFEQELEEARQETNDPKSRPRQ